MAQETTPRAARTLLCIGDSHSVPAEMRSPASWSDTWRDRARFWLQHDGWTDELFRYDLYLSRLLEGLRREEVWSAKVWARPWWTLRDFLRVARLVRSRPDVVIVQGGMMDVRPNDFSYWGRQLVNMSPIRVQDWATRFEFDRSARGALRFPRGWWTPERRRGYLVALLGQVRKLAPDQILVVLDTRVSEEIEALLPGLRSGVEEFRDDVRGLAPDFGAEIVDAAELYGGDPGFYEKDTVHWSMRGHQRVCDELLSEIRRHRS